MASTNNSGLGHGTKGSPQKTIDELLYPNQVDSIESMGKDNISPIYEPSPKHDKGGWGTNNPIKSLEEGQQLLELGYHDGKQIYNITTDRVFVKFQPSNTTYNGYHSYEVFKTRDIPPRILKEMLKDGKISRAEYNKIRKGKKIL